MGTAEHLDAALTAIELRNFAGALDALLAAFAVQRSAALGELVDAVSARLPAQTPLKTRRGLDKFKRILDEGRAADVTFLVESADAVGGLALLDQRPPDPRIAMAFARELAAMSERSPSLRPYYARLLRGLALLAYPPTLADLARARASAKKLGVASFRAWMLEEIEATIAAISAATPAPDDAAAIVALRTALANDGAARARAGATIDELEAEVYANPDDLGPRHVLADALVQAGDPRGELIALQLLPELDRKQRARVNAIIRDHRARLLGPLADRVLADGLVFERGFPVRGRLRRPMFVTDVFPRVPHWSTFTSLVAEDLESMQELPLRWLREIHEVTEAFLDRLAAQDQATRLEVMSFSFITRDIVERLRGLMTSVLPALRSVGWTAPYGAAYGAADGALRDAMQALPVEEIVIRTGWNVVASPLLRCATATRRVVVAYRDAQVIARDRELAFEVREARREFGVDEVVRTVRELADQFSSVVLPANALGDAVAPLVAAFGITVHRAGA